MRGIYDLMVLPLFVVLLVSSFHWMLDNALHQLRLEKQVFNASDRALDRGDELLVGGCINPTHHITETPAPDGGYQVWRAGLLDGTPVLLAIGNS